ncbi:hypothetical protein LCGC14_1247210 [marine sediment metagenome]|uniref:Uncharacterized protein n=1 Tax=marine sediment metagenome TaxID=412755 RepID=A0A0F9NLD2_9ZZZZ
MNNQEKIRELLEGYCEWCLAQGGNCYAMLDGCSIADAIALLKPEPTNEKIRELVEHIDKHLNTAENSQVYYELEDAINNIFAILKQEPCRLCGGSKTYPRRPANGPNEGLTPEEPCPNCPESQESQEKPPGFKDIIGLYAEPESQELAERPPYKKMEGKKEAEPVSELENLVGNLPKKPSPDETKKFLFAVIDILFDSLDRLEAAEKHRDRLIEWCGKYAASPACMMERLDAETKRADEAEKELEKQKEFIQIGSRLLKTRDKEIKQLQAKHEIYKTNTKAICDKLETRLKAAEGEKVTDEDILKAKAKKDEAVAKWNET